MVTERGSLALGWRHRVEKLPILGAHLRWPASIHSLFRGQGPAGGKPEAIPSLVRFRAVDNLRREAGERRLMGVSDVLRITSEGRG